MDNVRLMRTSLYAGGTSPVKMIQAGFYNEDCIVYDLEDSVSLGEKDAARFLVYNLVKYQRPKDKYVIIRVNGLYSEFLNEDLEASVRAQPDAIRLPKVEYPEEVKKIDSQISEIERKAGIPEGKVQLWCNIESYLGVMNAEKIAKASPRVVALALGAEDFTASMSAERTKKGWEIFYARNVVLMACRAAGISAQDAVFSDLNDTEGLDAVISGGHCGFGLGATPNAIANMTAMTELFGPAPTAFFVIPLIGSLIIDPVNASVITIFINLFH